MNGEKKFTWNVVAKYLPSFCTFGTEIVVFRYNEINNKRMLITIHYATRFFLGIWMTQKIAQKFEIYKKKIPKNPLGLEFDKTIFPSALDTYNPFSEFLAAQYLHFVINTIDKQLLRVKFITFNFCQQPTHSL